jgi:hypothetical protein
MTNGSDLIMHGLPVVRDRSNSDTTIADDVLYRPLNALDCRKVSGRHPIVRLVNAHWTTSRSKLLISILRKKKGEGCDVRVLLGPSQSKSSDHYKRLTASASGSEKPVSVHWFDNTLNKPAGLHVKYVVIEGSNLAASELMFGSMSITKTSHDNNDEIWNVWKNPSKSSFEFYRDSFDRVWASAK